MLRKLTSLLFKEEEIVIEEEEHEVEPVSIPELKPIQPVKRREAVAENRIAEQPIVEAEKPVETPPRKSFRIDLDTASSSSKPTQELKNPQSEIKRDQTKPYVAQEVLSPIHGGSALQNQPLHTPKKPVVKRREPLTQVISPMYGKVEDDASIENEALDLSILELDVESMITPDYNKDSETEAVQTSLFDYLEGDDSSES